MYAVVKTGGKQYRVVAGEKLKVEQIPADIGAEIVLDQVLLLANEVKRIQSLGLPFKFALLALCFFVGATFAGHYTLSRLAQVHPVRVEAVSVGADDLRPAE